MKFKSFLLLALFSINAVAAVAAITTQKNKYIGYKHKGVVYGATLPNGVKNLGGGLLSSEDYGVSRFSVGKKQMLWLEKVTSLDAKGVPNWQVKDVLVFDDLEKNQEFLMSYSSTCTQNGKQNLDLVVRAELQPEKKIYKILEAWRANLRKEKFEKIAVKGIKCEYVAP